MPGKILGAKRGKEGEGLAHLPAAAFRSQLPLVLLTDPPFYLLLGRHQGQPQRLLPLRLLHTPPLTVRRYGTAWYSRNSTCTHAAHMSGATVQQKEYKHA